MLSVVDRKVQVRSRNLKPLIETHQGDVAELASGMLQHLNDDHWFSCDSDLQSAQFGICSRHYEKLFLKTRRFAPHFLGHILIELLLDARLAECNPGLLNEYYDVLGQVDPVKIQSVINMASTPRPIQFPSAVF